jgi:hypothetical protein
MYTDHTHEWFDHPLYGVGHEGVGTVVEAPESRVFKPGDKVGGSGWGAGVSAVLVGNLSKQISSAFIANQFLSFDGDFSTMGLQPNIFYNFESLPGAYFG